MNVLITGGTGTISSGLVKESVNRGNMTYAITRGTQNVRNISGAIYITADIWNHDDIASKLGDLQFDVIVECLVYDVEQLKISLSNFADRCQQYIFISTAGVYQRIGEKRISENDLKNCTDWSYTKNKIECENYLIKYATENKMNYTIVRPTVTYGDYRIPFPIATRTPGWTFFDRMEKGQLMLASDNVRFSIIHIEDFSKMVVSLFGNKKALNEDFHITSDDGEILWDDVIKIAGKKLGVEPQIIHVPANVIRKVWPSIYDELAYHKNTTQIFDNKKIKGVTNQTASISVEDGVRRTIDAMHYEFNYRKLEIDKDWNAKCDATIYYAYKKHLLSKHEMNVVACYMQKHGRNRMKSALRKSRIDALKRIIKEFLVLIRVRKK